MSVRRAPEYWKYLPYFSKIKGCLLLNKIYIRSDIYDNLLSEDPDPQSRGVLIHEQTHLDRMRKAGFWQFGLRYVFSRKARLEEEIIAYTEQIRYLRSVGKELDIERIARALSGWIYFWVTDYDTAKQLLSNA